MQPSRKFSPNCNAIIALMVVAFTTAALSLATLNHLKDVVIDASLHGRPVSLALLVGTIRSFDYVLLGLNVITTLALPWLEFRQRAFSRLLLNATPGEAFAVLTILVAWFGHSYLSPGLPLGGDTGTHISRFLEVSRGLDQGELPQWTNFQYGGAPLLWFTGPLTYVVGGGLTFLLRDPVLAAKVLLFTFNLLSGWLYYAFLRRLGMSAIASMVAAAAFAGSFAHLHLFLYRGVFPQAFTIAFLVLLFFAADGLMREKGLRATNVLIFGLATAAMIVNHQPHALFAALYLGVFAFGALLSGFWKPRGIPYLAIAGILGAIASAIAVFPTIAEADWVMIDPNAGLFHVQWPTVQRLLNLLIWRNTRTTWGYDYWAYVGIGMIGFGLTGLGAFASGRLRSDARALARAAIVPLGICFFLFNPVVRDILFMLFFLGIFMALGLDWVMRPRAFAGSWRLAAILLAVADLASTSIQPVLRIDKGFLVDAGRRLASISADRRVMELHFETDDQFEADTGPDSGPSNYYANVLRLAGNHNMAATRIHNFAIVAIEAADGDLHRSRALSEQARDQLALFNVGRIICNTRIANGCPGSFAGLTEDPVLGRFIPVDQAAPALFSRNLVAVPQSADLEKPMLWPTDFEISELQPRIGSIGQKLHDVLAAEAVDWQRHTARAIAVADAAAVVSTPDSPDWNPVLRSYSVGLDTVRVAISSDKPGYVQLAHPWFPSTVATVNGSVVKPIRGSIDFMVLPIGAGETTIELHEGTTPVRIYSAWLSVLGVVLTLAASLIIGWRDRSGRQLTA